MMKFRVGSPLLAGVGVAVVSAVTMVAPTIAQAAPAPCVWYPSQHKIRCDNGAIMSNYSEAKNAATADAHYAGRVTYFVICRRGDQCEWSRV